MEETNSFLWKRAMRTKGSFFLPRAGRYIGNDSWMCNHQMILLLLLLSWATGGPYKPLFRFEYLLCTNWKTSDTLHKYFISKSSSLEKLQTSLILFFSLQVSYFEGINTAVLGYTSPWAVSCHLDSDALIFHLWFDCWCLFWVLFCLFYSRSL